MKATHLEFRFRVIIALAIYLVGFRAPWLIFGHAAEANPTLLWSWLPIELARIGVLSVQSAYVLITLAAVVLAALGAVLRVWGTAYLGRSVVFDHAMQAGAVVAAGPYRHVRNPLYLGSVLTAFAISILMPASGAVVFLLLFALFVARLALGEEAFLKTRIGDAYAEYCERVPRWLPSLSPRLASSGGQPMWLPAAVGEVFPLGMALSFLVFSWRYDADLLVRCILICFGCSLVSRAFRPKRAA